VAGSCEHDNEPPGSVRCGYVLWLVERLFVSQEGLLFISSLFVEPHTNILCGSINFVV
jgi:hypothetical protein